MQNALRVGSREAIAELMTDVDHLLGRQPAHPANQGREVFAMDELHGVEHLARSFADIEHPADRGVGNLAGEPHFLEDDLPRLWIGRVNQLERDLGLEHQIVGAPDLSHPAFAEARNHAISAGEDMAGQIAGGVCRRPQRGGGTG